MHSYHGKKHNYHFNGDFSGEINIIDKETGTEIKIETEELVDLILNNGLEQIEKKVYFGLKLK